MGRTSPVLSLALLAVAATLVPIGTARAACEVPLVIERTAGEANVLIILDSSGSMNEAMTHSAYNPSTSYSGNFSSSNTYGVSSDGNYTPLSFNSSWPNSPTAYLVNSDGGRSGDYTGNYLNWVFFHATAAQRAAIPTVTRIQVAKSVINTVLANKPAKTQYGVMKFNGDNGGILVSPVGTPIATLQAQVNSIVAEGYTPLAETLVSAMTYFQGTGAGAPILGDCQKSFVILASDGLPTKDLNVPSYVQTFYDGNAPCSGTDCSDYLDDVTAYLHSTDMRPDIPGMQNLTTFTIGMNIDAEILQSAATQGGGTYYTTDNPAQLTQALNDALGIIDVKVSAGASVSVVSAEGQTNNRLYRARFESVSWRGFVEAFSLPYTSGATPLWEAGALLESRNPNTREIFTSTTGSNKVNLSTGNAATLQTLLGAANTTEATNIIQYSRGTHLAGSRDRQGWKLGDIVDSSPIAAGKPAAFHSFLSYPSFRTSNAGRTEMIYVGANDGMLHCLNASTGAEEWAYVPKNQLPRLKNLMSPSYCHEYFVNMTPAVYDIHVGGSWKTVLIGGQERGGSGLFALNVTNPSANNVSVLWDIDLPALKGSWNRPALVRDKTRNAYVLCASTGLDSTTGLAKLVLIDPANGSVLDTHTLGSAASVNMATAATAFDRDFDGFDDLLYVADLAGKVWRVDLTTNPWTVSLLFDNSQPIQAQPVLTMDEQGRVMVFFGTGRYLNVADLSTTSTQTFYGVVDDHSGTTVTRADLVNQTSTIQPVTSTARGWYVDLVQYAGERVIRTAALIAGTLHFPSFRPLAAVCQSGGESWLYRLDFEDGSAPDHSNQTENNTTYNRVDAMGSGILSNPSVDLLNEDIILQSSTTSMISQDIDVAQQRVVIRSWRQVWN